MITPNYCLLMARYNKWQNENLAELLADCPHEELTKDAGAFFGSILGTLNHLLWGDTIWIARYDGGPGVDVDVEGSSGLTDGFTMWKQERVALDLRLLDWAYTVSDDDLAGELRWYSTVYKRDFAIEKKLGVMQIFNHQTHHRGQIHAMMTAMGMETRSTDLPMMPAKIESQLF